MPTIYEDLYFMFKIFLSKPLDLYYLSIWRLCGWLLLLLIWYLSLEPRLNQFAPALLVSDKLGHFIAYALLMAWFAQWHQRPYFRILALVFISMGVALELLQGISGLRQFDPWDMLANSIGVVVAWLICYSPLGRSLLWLENRWLTHY